MKAWPTVPLGDVVLINPRFAGDRALSSLPVSFVPMAAVSERTGSIVSSEVRSFGEVSKGFPIFSDGDVLFAKITPCMENGKAAIAKELENGIGAGSTEFFVLRSSDKIIPGFVFHFIRRNSFRQECKLNFTGSAGQQRVPKSFLERVPIPLPPLDEQRRIVQILDRSEEIKRRSDVARNRTRAIVPSMFSTIFGDPRDNPKGWPLVTIGDIIRKISGGKNIEAGNGTSSYRIMKVSAVTSGIFKPEESKPAPNDYLPPPEHLVRDGDFLFSRANTSELVGAVAIARDPPSGLLLPDKIWRIEWDKARVDPQYAYSLLRHAEIRNIFASISSGTSASMQNISQAKLVNITIPLPPLARQAAFAAQVDRVEAIARQFDVTAAKAAAMAAGLAAEVFG